MQYLKKTKGFLIRGIQNRQQLQIQHLLMMKLYAQLRKKMYKERRQLKAFSKLHEIYSNITDSNSTITIKIITTSISTSFSENHHLVCKISKEDFQEIFDRKEEEILENRRKIHHIEKIIKKEFSNLRITQQVLKLDDIKMKQLQKRKCCKL